MHFKYITNVLIVILGSYNWLSEEDIFPFWHCVDLFDSEQQIAKIPALCDRTNDRAYNCFWLAAPVNSFPLKSY